MRGFHKTSGLKAPNEKVIHESNRSLMVHRKSSHSLRERVMVFEGVIILIPCQGRYRLYFLEFLQFQIAWLLFGFQSCRLSPSQILLARADPFQPPPSTVLLNTLNTFRRCSAMVWQFAYKPHTSRIKQSGLKGSLPGAQEPGSETAKLMPCLYSKAMYTL